MRKKAKVVSLVRFACEKKMGQILQARRLQKAHVIHEDFAQTARMRRISLCRALAQMYVAFLSVGRVLPAGT